jgi:hypothetical protein
MGDIGRNLIHNPLFNVAQRGVGPWTTSQYTLDRWRIDLNLDVDSISQSQYNDAQRAAVGDEEAINVMVAGVTGNAGAAAFSLLSQPVENVRRLANKTVTVSFWAHASSGTPKVGVGFRQFFGTGGSPSAFVDLNATAVTLSTTPARYSITTTLPSIAGKTLGTNNDHYTRMGLWLSSGATNNALAGGVGVQGTNFVFWGVQLEIGSVATPLEKPDPRYDLSNCQRFYQVGYFNYGGYGAAGTPISVSQQLPVTMRVAPTMVNTGGGAATNVSSPVLGIGNGSNSGFYIGGSVTGVGNFAFYGNYSASADL